MSPVEKNAEQRVINALYASGVTNNRRTVEGAAAAAALEANLKRAYMREAAAVGFASSHGPSIIFIQFALPLSNRPCLSPLYARSLARV